MILCCSRLKGNVLLNQIEGLIAGMRESYRNNIRAVLA